MRGEIGLLNSRDIAALNRARQVLRHLEAAAWKESLEHFDPYAPVTAWDIGRLSEAASAADDAIFHLLSTARTNCRLRVTEDQLFGTEHTPPNAAQAPEAAQPIDPPKSAVARPTLRTHPSRAGARRPRAR